MSRLCVITQNHSYILYSHMGGQNSKDFHSLANKILGMVYRKESMGLSRANTRL